LTASVRNAQVRLPLSHTGEIEQKRGFLRPVAWKIPPQKAVVSPADMKAEN
jgi:hypothetical protein